MTREEAITYFEDAKEICESLSISTKTTHISAYEMAIEALRQPEQKKGYWIGRPIAGYATVRCSVCTELFFENQGRWNFCPNCGATMEEKE